MQKKIYSWEFWDWGSILDTILVFIFFFGIINLFLISPGLIRKEKLKNLDAETTANVISVKKYQHAGTRQNSSTIYLDGIIVTYNYVVNGIAYSKLEVIPDNGDTRRFEYILLDYPESTIHIKYSSKNPGNSLIITDFR